MNPTETDLVLEFRKRTSAVPLRCERCGARSQSICDALSERELQKLAAISGAQAVAPNRTIIDEGDPAQALFNITAGTVRTYRALPDGRRQIIGFLGPGDFLGVAPGERYSVSADAITPVEACRFPKREFEALLKAFPKLEERLFQKTSNELALAQDQLLTLGRKTAAERLATFLLARMNKRGCQDKTAHCLDLPMTRADIADHLGLTMETVSRMFSKFAESGVIAVGPPGRVEIKNKDRLEDIAGGLAI